MTSLTPKALIFEDILRAVCSPRSGSHMPTARVVELTGRAAGNIHRDLAGLVTEGLLEGDKSIGWRITAAGMDARNAMDRANGVGVPVAGLPLQPLDKIEYNPDNPRKGVAEEPLQGLADTIAEADGLLQPIVLYPAGANGVRMLHAGERRVRACRMLEAEGRLPASLKAGLPFIERAATKAEALFIGLVENSQRENLTPFEDAQALKAYQDETGLSARAIAFKLGRAREGSEEGVRDVQEKIKAMTRAGEKAIAEVAAGRQNFEWLRRQVRKTLAEAGGEQLRPIDLMTIAEVRAQGMAKPRNRYYGGDRETECSYTAGKDAVLKGLVSQGILSFVETAHDDHKAYVGLSHNTYTILATEEFDGLERGGNATQLALHRLRTAAVGSAEADKAAQTGKYITAWLNGPFEYSAKAQEKMAAAKKTKTETRQAAKLQKEKLAKRMDEVQALGEKVKAVARTNGAPTSERANAFDALKAEFGAVNLALPVKVAGRSIVDANDNAIVPTLSWRFYEKEPIALELLALALNAAFAFPTARREFERWIANRLMICGLDPQLAKDRAGRVLDDYLAHADLEYQASTQLWGERQAAEIADGWFAAWGAGLPEDGYVAWVTLFLQHWGWTSANAPATARRALAKDLERHGIAFGDPNYSWDKEDARQLAADYFAELPEDRRPQLPQDKTPVVTILDSGPFNVPPDHWDDPDAWIARHVRDGELIDPNEQRDADQPAQPPTPLEAAIAERISVESRGAFVDLISSELIADYAWPEAHAPRAAEDALAADLEESGVEFGAPGRHWDKQVAGMIADSWAFEHDPPSAEEIADAADEITKGEEDHAAA